MGRGGREASPQIKMEEYLATLERQDELFELALDIIKQGLGSLAINSAAIVRNAVAIDTRRSELLEYLKDAESLVAFRGSPLPSTTLPQRSAAATASQENTKFGMIYGDRSETLSTLLLFPARVRNVFLEALANIIVSLADDTIALLDVPAAKQIFKDQLESYAQAYAYTMTARPLRDGFYIKQTQEEYATLMRTFWADFITEVFAVRNTAPLTALFKPGIGGGCAHLITVDGARAGTAPTFGYLAAHIWRAHKLGATTEVLLGLFDTPCTPETDRAHAARPNAEFDGTVVRGVTLGNLFTHMEPKVLEFLLHLWYLIGKAAINRTP
ncbi:hypothetical protein EBZ80_11345 [bacterium]|nr:hypothetical protein [bacterium]